MDQCLHLYFFLCILMICQIMSTPQSDCLPTIVSCIPQLEAHQIFSNSNQMGFNTSECFYYICHMLGHQNNFLLGRYCYCLMSLKKFFMGLNRRIAYELGLCSSSWQCYHLAIGNLKKELRRSSAQIKAYFEFNTSCSSCSKITFVACLHIFETMPFVCARNL